MMMRLWPPLLPFRRRTCRIGLFSGASLLVLECLRAPCCWRGLCRCWLLRVV